MKIDLLLIGGLAACIAIAATLAIAEVSLLRVRRTQVAPTGSGDPGAERLLRLLDDLPVVLNAVLLLVLLCQVGAATISAVLAARWFGGVGVPAMSMLLTALLFVYGEALPKTRAIRDPHRNALRLAPVLNILVFLLRRPVALLLLFVDLQLHDIERHDVASEAELRLLAREAAAVGEIEQADVTLMERSFRFGDLQVRHVMVPRATIRSVQATESVEDGFARALAFGHRRLPVIGVDLDEILGVVRLRDLAAASASTPAGQVAGSLMNEPLFCSPSDSLAETLQSMQANAQWLAIAVAPNESQPGSLTVGLVTIEDIVAELVGEIADDRAEGWSTRNAPAREP